MNIETKQNTGGCNSRRHLTPMTLSRRWDMHEESIRRMARQRRLPFIKIGRRILFLLDDVERIEAQGRFEQQ